ncbi:MAG: hypothetical protein NTW87_23180 [Planctomycetota bacterium]|nr:hypothetical protein [Planctomycetota bacterium]
MTAHAGVPGGQREVLARALAVLLLAGCHGGLAAGEPTPVYTSPPEAPPAASVDAAYSKGVAYLLTHQNANGSWGSFESARSDEVWLGTTASHDAFGDATTGLCVMALLVPARDNAETARAVEKAAQFLFKRRPVHRATGDAIYSVWAQIYVLEAASAVLQEPSLKPLHSDARKSARKQIEVLGQIQGSEGGFGYYDFGVGGAHPGGMQSASFTTAAALIALDHAKAAGISVPDELTKDALRSLSRLRLGNGAYIYGVYARNVPQVLFNDVKGSLGRSQVCNQALWRYATGVSQDDLRTGLDNLFKHHQFIEMGKGRPYPHESWYFTAGYYFFFGHYYAAQVARELPAEQGRRYLDGLQSVMCRLQDPDGSWWDFPLYGYYKPYGTAFALMTLQLAKR